MSEIDHVSPDEKRPILIADAEEENARHVERQLRRAGVKHPVVVIQDGDDLHALLVDCGQSTDPKPCVLLLDPRMPGANGFDPVRWVKREQCLSDLKIALFLGTENPEEIDSATELGVSYFLKKHPDIGSLTPIIDHLCGTQPSMAAVEVPAIPLK